MRRATRNLLLLALGTAALGIAVAWLLRDERARLPKPLTALEPASIRHLEIHCQHCTTRIFERRADGWWMLQPHAAPADPQAVDRLLAIAASRVRSRTPLAGYDLPRLGLAPPRFRVVLDDTHIDIGDEDPIDHDRYVRIGDALLHVPDRFSARLLEAPESELLHPL